MWWTRCRLTPPSRTRISCAPISCSCFRPILMTIDLRQGRRRRGGEPAGVPRRPPNVAGELDWLVTAPVHYQAALTLAGILLWIKP